MTKRIYCNKCGRKMDDFDINQNFFVQKMIGYGSKYDGDEIRVRLCNECLDDLIDECAVSPIIHSVDDEQYST